MGSHSNEHVELAGPLGHWLGRQGYHLLTGGGPGVMAAVSRAFCEVAERGGLTLGVIPADSTRPGMPRSGYPNAWIEVPLFTHLDQVGDQGDQPLAARGKSHCSFSAMALR